MALPWVRLDSNIFTHDKVLTVLGERDGHRAMLLYVFALAYSGGHATDGFIPRAAIPVLSGTIKQATALIEARLWEYAEGGYRIRNWEQRQELTTIADAKRAAQRVGGLKATCKRHHGPDCGCWKDAVDGAA